MKNFAEFLGTFWLISAGCGSVLLASELSKESLMWTVPFAFGLASMIGVYALGPISGGHFNPAVTIGMWAGGRASAKDLLPYILSQCSGAIVAAGFLYVIMTSDGFDIGSFASNGYGEHSPGGYAMEAAIAAEFTMTFMFVLVVLSATDRNTIQEFSGLVIGAALMLVHLVTIPVTNTSVNPARSLSQAIFAGGDALAQLWLFIIVPIAGALTAGAAYRGLEKSYQQGGPGAFSPPAI